MDTITFIMIGMIIVGIVLKAIFPKYISFGRTEFADRTMDPSDALYEVGESSINKYN